MASTLTNSSSIGAHINSYQQLIVKHIECFINGSNDNWFVNKKKLANSD